MTKSQLIGKWLILVVFRHHSWAYFKYWSFVLSMSFVIKGVVHATMIEFEICVSCLLRWLTKAKELDRGFEEVYTTHWLKKMFFVSQRNYVSRFLLYQKIVFNDFCSIGADFLSRRDQYFLSYNVLMNFR